MARSTRNAQDSRITKYNLQIHLDAIFLKSFSFFSYNDITCQSRMFQMWLSFAAAFTSAFKSSDWTQKTIQIQDDLPLLPSAVPTPILLEFKVILYKVAQRRNTVPMNLEWKRRGNTSSIMWYKTERGYDCLAIQSTVAMDIWWPIFYVFYKITW